MTNSQARDPALEALLALDGEVMVVDPAGKHWVKFTVKAVEASEERPHGIVYSFTLHDERGRRLVGFDNSHSVRSVAGPSGRGRRSHDHRHRLQTVRPYTYTDAMTLLSDFWDEVESMLREREVNP